MNHSQYKHWILDEITLSADQENLLEKHLDSCKECRQLKSGWEASSDLLIRAKMAVPAQGFSLRWNETLARKTRLEKVRRYRLTVTGLLIAGFLTSLIYLVASGSFLHVLANSFTAIAQALIAITNGLSIIGYWFNRMPVALPLMAGFILFGMVTAFLMTAAFALWNINQRKKLAHEIAIQ